MSAPIDDLLYGGDDSGDEDMSASIPMRSFATPLPLASGLAPLPLAPAGAAPLGGPVSAAATVAAAAKPLAMATPAPVLAATPPALRPAPFPPVAAAGQPAAAGTAVGATGAAPAAKASGSGQQMFQQMFALLKQMLPAEQYATLHSEMRKGNGNDIKSIVDIIKRIAGDAIFSSVIQKMDLTRSFPSNSTPAANTVKTEATVQTPSRISPTSSALSAARTGAAAVTTGGAIPVGLPLQMPGASSALGSAAGVPTTVAQTPVLPATSRFVKPAAPAAGLAGATVSSTTALKPAGPISSPSRPAVSLPGLSVGAVKPEPSIAPTSTPPPSTTANTSKSTGASPSASPSSVKNEALEKILYAKRLLLHASTCSLEPGVCQFKKCDDVRRVFKHSASCGGANGCTHCEQLKGLVKYHAKECQHSLTEHCAIPFCDGLRRAYMSATAALGGVKSSAAASQALAAASAARKSSNGTSDDDDDNTPLASVSKKKNPGKAKSPKSAIVPKVGPTTTVNTHKKKPTVTTPKAGGATASPSNASQVSSTPATTASSTGAAGNAPNKAAATVTANMTLEYGRLLQLILHVQKCSSAACPVGKECADAKSLLQQINSPNAPARAKTYKQVYAHYKLCVAKNNTSTCPMCKIGLRPILPVTTTAPALSPGPSVGTPTNSSSQSPGSQAAKPVAAGLGSGAGSSVSPLKRTNSMTTPSPRSPKKARTGGKSKVGGAEGPVASISVNGDIETGIELVQASITDIRKEADVLTHTGLDLTAERRIMMGTGAGHSVELLPCKKEEWVETDLFDSSVLTAHMRAIGRRCGVTLGAHTSDVMAYALREYLKQVMEEMVEVAKQRSDAYAQNVALPGETHGVGNRVELTATDILRVSCEDSFSRLRQEDLAMRATLLEDAKREEMIERERAKKRKKVDRSKLAQEEKDEAEMDIEELATKDLKERLLREDKEGVTRVDGRVNESISARYAPHRADHQVTMEDAAFWLHKQRPYVKPKLFARAEVARIVTKALN